MLPARVTRGTPRRHELAALAVILALYAISLGRTCHYDFVWDDVPEIERSPAFDQPLADGLMLTQTQRSVPELAQLAALQFGYDSYRPLLFASYWADIRLWGRDAGALHRTNVILGGLAILLAYALARRLLGSPVAWIATALFALHPLQIEAVAYVSARGDLLAGLFGLAAGYAAVRAIDTAARRRAIAWTAAAALAFAASLLAKESGIALPLAIAALVAARAPGSPRRRWWIAATLLAIAAAYLPLRAAMVPTVTAPPYAAALVGLPGALLEYARLAVLPFDLSIERAPHPAYIAVGWIVAAIASATLVALARRRAEVAPWLRTVLAGAAWAIALLAPSAVALRTMNVVADRYAYAAMFGLGFAVAAAAAELARARPHLARIAAVVAALWALALLAVGWWHVPTWTDTSTLYRATVEIAPDSSRAHYRVAVLEIQADRWDRAVPELEQAIALDPANVDALNNLGVYQLRSDPTAAAATLQRAITANPAHFRSWLNLGLAQLATGQRAAGCASIAHALAIDPAYAAALAAQQRSCAAP